MGTAGDYAERLAQEAKSRFGLNPMVVNLEDYDDEDVHFIARACIFVLATYGKGELTDNAVLFYEFVTSSKAPSLPYPRFSVFEPGNKTYEQFNWRAHSVDEALRNLEVDRLGKSDLGYCNAGPNPLNFT